MSIGMDDHRVPPKYLLQKTLEQVKQLAGQKPEDSPLALPLKKFPASISAVEQERIKLEMLAAIGKQVLPAYTRFTRFLEASYIPAGRDEPGISALADGAKYYQFLIRRTTTTDLSAEKIHQIGLDEVKKDEADMLAIAQKLGFQDLKSFRASIKGNPKLKATSRESLLESYRGYLGPMQAKLPSLFGRLPKAPLKLRQFRITWRRPPRPHTMRPAHQTEAGRVACASTLTMRQTAIFMPSSRSRTTRVYRDITCRSPSRAN